MKIAGLPKLEKWTKNFDGDFKGLRELKPYDSLDDSNPPASEVSREVSHMIKCKRTPSGRLSVAYLPPQMAPGARGGWLT